VFAVFKNVLSFAKPAKPESGCQGSLLIGLLRRLMLGRQEPDLDQPQVLVPARTVAHKRFISCGVVKVSELRRRSMTFLKIFPGCGFFLVVRMARFFADQGKMGFYGRLDKMAMLEKKFHLELAGRLFC